MELAALIISIASIFFSTIISAIEISISKKHFKISLYSQIYDDIFKDYLIKIIPDRRRYLIINAKGKLTGASTFIDMLQELLQSSIYYQYEDKTFYKKLKNSIIELEDYLINCNNKKSLDEKVFMDEVDGKVKKLYKILDDKKNEICKKTKSY